MHKFSCQNSSLRHFAEHLNLSSLPLPCIPLFLPIPLSLSLSPFSSLPSFLPLFLSSSLPLSLSPSPPHSLSPSLLLSLFPSSVRCSRELRETARSRRTRGRKAWRDPVRWIGQPSIRGCACRGDPPARFDFSHAAFPGWPTRSSAANEDGGGRARLAQTAARPVAECWPRHLRCHARARTRAHARRAALYDEHGARE